MPNHCQNELVIYAYSEDGYEGVMDAFVEKYFTKDEKGNLNLDENKIIPYPAEFKERDKFIGSFREKYWAEQDPVKKEEILKIVREKYPTPDKGFPADAYNSGGYEWCIENWGTKWGMYNQEILERDDERMVIHFQTAWSPGSVLIAELARQNPHLTFDLCYYERGMAYKGECYYANGELEYSDEGKYYGNKGG